jgi:hypothetical protein
MKFLQSFTPGFHSAIEKRQLSQGENMKVFLLALVALTLSAETFAQRGRAPVGRGSINRGGSVTNPNTGRTRDIPGRDDGRPGPGGDRPSDHRYTTPYERPISERYDRPVNRGPVYSPGRVVVSPRYIPTGRPVRIYRTIRRTPIIWSIPFGYNCGIYGDLSVNGRLIHNFYYSSDCYSAIEDIRVYGDFCDNADLYDQTGILEAQFSSNYECRDAIGYYY